MSHISAIATTQPDTQLVALPSLDEADRQQVLMAWNDTTSPYPDDVCVHHQFEAQAARTPGATAVSCDGRTLTYQMLDAQANQLARHLQAMGLQPENRVGVYLNRSVEMIVSILAVLKAGGAYLPIDVNYPAQRVQFMLEDAQAPILITHSDLRPQLPPQLSYDVLCLDELTLTGSQTAPTTAVLPQNLAYVIYTSGSTGRPKGVPITHRSLMNLVIWHQTAFALTAADRATQLAGFAFDASVWETWPYLTCGASLHLPDEMTRLDPQHLRDWLVAEGITITFLPTPLAQAVLDLSWPQDGTLRLLLTGGEALTRYPPSNLPFTLINNYGPTENTVVTTSGVIEPVTQVTTAPDIGRPIANMQVYLLDQALQPVPIGEPGELYIGGVGLTRGYLDRPRLTAARFVPHPFSQQPGARLYRTGDLVRYRANGRIEFVGRIDDQVKIRGFRIELGEIETALRQNPLVQSGVVIAREETPDSKRLVAYITLATDTPPDIEELRHFLGSRLPHYMIPSTFVVLDSLPLTPNGKVDRKALPAPQSARSTHTADFVAPRTPAEEMIATVMADLLQESAVGIHDNFFALGGHSLMVIQLISRLNAHFQVALSLHELFEQPTVAQLAAKIEQLEPVTTAVSLPRHYHTGPMPLSFAQQRLWFMTQLVPHSPLYNIPALFTLTGTVDTAVLNRCLTEIVRRHEALRTTFTEEKGQPRQVVHPPLPLELTTIDLRPSPAAERSRLAQQHIETEARRPFDLGTPPLLRAFLLQIDDTTAQLLLTIHHIIADGWSMGVLIEELAVLYPAFLANQPSPLPELPIQYSDFAHWQRQQLQEGKLETERAYWQTQFQEAPPVLTLPTDYPRPVTRTYHGHKITRALPLSLINGLEAVSQEENATLFMTMLAAFQALLYRHTGQTDIVIGVPFANRTHADMEKLMGFFVNTLPLRSHLADNPTFRHLIRQVRQMALDAYTHQMLPLEQIIEAFVIERHSSHNTLFQVVFAWQNMAIRPVSLPDLHIQFEQDLSTNTAKFDLSLFVEFPHGLPTVVAEYNTDLFTAAAIERLLAHFQVLLTAAAQNPDLRLTHLPLLTQAERQQQVITWNETTVPYPQDTTLHHQFEHHAAHTPEATALVVADQAITYAQLNQQANQLAHYLRQQGVQPGNFVCLYLPRSPEMIIAILATLKVGGVYVPIDATYPTERVAFILNDAQAPILLTQQSVIQELHLAAETIPHTQIVPLDAVWPMVRQQAATNLNRPAAANEIAYTIYTSGSTGTPKGVICHHQGVLNLLSDFNQRVPLPTGARHSMWTSISFDVSIYEIFGALTTGGTLYLVAEEMRLDSFAFFAWLAHHRIHNAYIPPFMLTDLIQWSQKEKPGKRPLSLQRLLVGVEPITEQTLAAIQQHIPGLSVINGYGPTEATVCATLYDFRLQAATEKNTPIGRPLQNTQIYLLNEALHPVPIGVLGELYIGGDGLAYGYWQRPHLTASKFIPHPFVPGGQRLYRTGDLARYQPDGTLTFFGRVDHQAKVRGFRIEVGEIETTLTRHPMVQEAVVIIREDIPGDKRLIAYLIATPDTTLDPEELQQFLKTKLPHYMIPSSIMILEAFPLSPNGKLDRQRLPIPHEIRPELATTFVAPRTPAEEKMAHIWAEVLRLKQVGIHDNFFSLGGHSLMATQLVFRIRDAFQIELPLNTLFESPTVAELTEQVEAVYWAMADTTADSTDLEDDDYEELEL